MTTISSIKSPSATASFCRFRLFQKSLGKTNLEAIYPFFQSTGTLFKAEGDQPIIISEFKVPKEKYYRLKKHKKFKRFAKCSYAHIKINDGSIESLKSSCKKLPVRINKLAKIAIFSPSVSSDAVKRAILPFCRKHQVVSTVGVARFMPVDGANPYIGVKGESESVIETKFECTLNLSRLKKLIEKVKKVHPYEEIGIDIYPKIKNKNQWFKKSLQFLNKNGFIFSDNIKIKMVIGREKASHLREILAKNGAGIIGNYTHCSFSTLSHNSKEELVETVASSTILSTLAKSLAESGYRHMDLDVYPQLKLTTT